jgi:hypothetical protein
MKSEKVGQQNLNAQIQDALISSSWELTPTERLLLDANQDAPLHEGKRPENVMRIPHSHFSGLS